jgi:mono/diheme cytochrome c family protein
VIPSLLSLTLLGLAGAPAGANAPDSSAFEATVKPFLAKSCLMCHNAQLKNGGVNFAAFDTAEDVTKDAHTWDSALVKLKTGQMPPEGFPRPDPAEVKAITEWVEKEFDRVDQMTPPNPGRVTARRLNRTEYNNTIRDLLAVDTHPADDFPQDDAGYGFDNIGDVLSLSPALLEKYLKAADKVTRAALFGPEASKPSMARLTPRTGKVQPSTVPLFDYDLTGLSLENSLVATHRFPADGEYTIRIVPGGTRPLGSEPVHIAVWIDGEQVKVVDLDPEGVATFELDHQELFGTQAEVRVKVAAGEHTLAASILRLYEGLPPSYDGPNPSKRTAPELAEFKPRKDAPPERIEAARRRFEARRAEKKPVNEARISRLEVIGPFAPAKGPKEASLRSVYSCGHLHGGHLPGCATRNVTSLARRAYRRPVTATDVDPLLRLFTGARKEGAPFEEATALALKAILVSPDFLFRIERDDPAAVASTDHPIGQYELASRLSYFLWSSMPDEELLRQAERKTLRDPEVLAAQVRRMLKDDKAEALVEGFGGQWLQFRGLESAAPDRDRFPDFDNNLRLSMRQETELFLDSIVREDRSILDLIDGKYSFMNERLARHYGIPWVKGPDFRRVDLTGTERGGVITQASVLTVSSYATRTSTVLRGKWVLDNILNAPPPDPPPGVPRLDETKVSASASLRQQMEAHRTNPTCASCHVRMDPIGFGLENYDGIGAWRNQDGKWDIDPAGALPDGRSFHGPEELKQILKQDKDAFALGMTAKLLTYALGRGLERYDQRAVKAIAASLPSREYRFSALVLEIVNSLPFQMRRGDRSAS